MTNVRIDERTANETERPTPTAPEHPLTTEDVAGSGEIQRLERTTNERAAESEAMATGAERTVADGQPRAQLFDKSASSELQERWDGIQAAFVDEPRSAVEQADQLVAELMKRLADSFASERRALEGQWSRGDDVSTEDLRVALRRYRSFFSRLLSV
jgi:hypothetical protein